MRSQRVAYPAALFESNDVDKTARVYETPVLRIKLQNDYAHFI